MCKNSVFTWIFNKILNEGTKTGIIGILLYSLES